MKPTLTTPTTSFVARNTSDGEERMKPVQASTDASGRQDIQRMSERLNQPPLPLMKPIQLKFTLIEPQVPSGASSWQVMRKRVIIAIIAILC